MTTRFPWAVLVSLSLVACGGAIGGSATSSTDTAPTDGGLVTDASLAADTTRTGPSTGVVWVHAEASGFDPRACNEPSSSDFAQLGDYFSTQMSGAGLKGAAINAGAGVCAFGSSPTTLSQTYVFAGTVAAVRALQAAPPAPFRGTYITVPLVVKGALNVKFEFFVGDGDAHAFDGVWVHEGLNFDGEVAFMNDICNKKASFDAAIVTSPAGGAVRAWLGSKSTGSTYRLGYDATFTFEDGTTTTITDANEATGGPYRAPCPNLAASP